MKTVKNVEFDGKKFKAFAFPGLETTSEPTVIIQPIKKIFESGYYTLGYAVYEGHGPINNEKDFDFHINKFLELARKNGVVGLFEYWDQNKRKECKNE